VGGARTDHQGRTALRRAAFAAAAFALALLVGEALFRAVFPLPEIANFNRVDYCELRRGITDQPPLMNASVAWTSEPDHASFVHSLNLYGFRDRITWCVRPPSGRTRVMFLGDSFVEGMMAGDDETIPVAFAAAARPPVEAMNLGMAGTGMGHYLRLAAAALPLFRPHTVILVLYANDLPPPALDPRWLAPSFHPMRLRRWLPRPLHVTWRALHGRVVARRWHAAPFSFFGAVPDPTNPLSDRAPGYEGLVEADLLAAMKRGAFNPYLTDHLARSAEALIQPAGARAHLEALAALARRQGATLRVAYLPHALQVSDYYMTFALRYAVEKPVTSLAGPEYQRQAEEVGRNCRELNVPFLDLTPVLRREEAAGHHLYWDYDNHMRAAGYGRVGRALADWMESGG
jgi:hypothetical protein